MIALNIRLDSKTSEYFTDSELKKDIKWRIAPVTVNCRYLDMTKKMWRQLNLHTECSRELTKLMNKNWYLPSNLHC